MPSPAPLQESSTSSWTATLDRAVDDCLEDLVAVRRYLHVHPEPSGHEERTIAYLSERLVDAGFDPIRSWTDDNGDYAITLAACSAATDR